MLIVKISNVEFGNCRKDIKEDVEVIRICIFVFRGGEEQKSI